MENCVFCRISRGEIPVKKIYENENFFSIPDAAPKIDGHSLIISKNHFETTLDLPSSLGGEFLDCVKRTTFKLIEKYKAEGFNLVGNNFESAGQVVKHFHMHLLPRKKNEKSPHVY